ncbi:alpha/beta hydrolase [Methylophaga pinxianii]|uniref:alpha/beta hydrolase n=1 Tax=Methylophaga pinxianii TaxID=2881052 RepID=UPI001CF2DCD6|nr:alpha/beta hydrolase [Methylophaga pinxianii]MCB2426445.1 alpha/beta hydrolase [Methylophaga pinxianii]UPH45015.1 alpha/beta hydrolase [Methylophaga pinxianii]
MTNHICFIQGDWVAPVIWENFERHFKACGYICNVLSLPDQDDDGWYHILNGKAVLDRLVDFYALKIAALPSPPVLIGHALGGLVVQILLDRGIGLAGVAIASQAPQRVFPDLGSLIHIFGAKSEQLHGICFLQMTSAQFFRHIAYPLTPQTIKLSYNKIVYKVPKRLMIALSLGIGSRLLFNQERGPLLLISGSDDRLVKSSVVLANYYHQRQSLAQSDYLLFPGYGHLLIMQPGWEQVADQIIEWLQQQLGRF